MGRHRHWLRDRRLIEHNYLCSGSFYLLLFFDVYMQECQPQRFSAKFDVGIHYVGNLIRPTLTRTLVEEISDGQIQWAPLGKRRPVIKE
jgi:hypothetical protein